MKVTKTKLSDDEITELAAKQINFLRTLFPFIATTPYRINYQGRRENLQIELRAMKRFDPGASDKKGTARYTSFNTFSLDQSCEEFLAKYIRQCNKSKFELCEYFIFSAFDKNITKNADEEPSNRPQMCNATNTAMIQSLMLDFDKLTKGEFIEHYTRLRQLGLEFLVVFTGHGYQVHFLLNQATRDIHALKSFVRLATVMGYPVDPSANTVSQLCRMPFTLNSKAYDPKFGYELEVIQTDLLITTEKRYSLDELFLKLSENQCSYAESWDALSMVKPDAVNTADEDFRASERAKIDKKIKAKIKLLADEKVQKEHKKTEKKKEKKEKVEKRAEILSKSAFKSSKNDMEVSFVAVNLKELYPNLDIESHAVGVQNLFKGPIEGYANLALKFMVAYLKSLDYKLAEIIEITKVWQGLDTFNYAWNDESFVRSETERFFKAHYKIDKGDLPGLEDIYGELFDEDGNYYSLKDKIIFDNKIFCELKDISPCAFVLLCTMKAENHRDRQAHPNGLAYTTKQLKELTLKDVDTIRDNMAILVKLDLVEKLSVKPEGKKGGRPTDHYKLTNRDIKEFTKIDAGKLDGLLLRASHPIKAKRISERAFMVAVYVRFRAFGSRKSCFMKQAKMAEEMGISRTRLTNAMAELEKHKLIHKKQHDIFSTLEYVIMY